MNQHWLLSKFTFTPNVVRQRFVLWSYMILSRKIDGVQQTYVDIIIGSAEYWEPDIHGEYRPVSHFLLMNALENGWLIW